MKEKLKPCPFCGEELITIANGQYYSHKREQDKEKQCFGGVWTFPVDDEEFIKLWNTRKPMDKVVQQLEEEMFIDKNGNNVLQGGTIDYEQRYKYEIGCNYGLTKAIKIVKDG